MKKLLFLFLLFGFGVIAQNNTAIFNLANQLYKNKKYEDAIEQYNKIIAVNQAESAELYYNLGNCHYKLDAIASTIYYYEKALLLAPNDKKIQTNLQLAQKRTIDNIKTIPEVGFNKLKKTITSHYSSTTWAWICISISGIILLFFVSYLFSNSSILKRTFFVGMGVAFVFLIFGLVFGLVQKDYEINYQPAIIFTEKVEVKEKPNTTAKNVILLHEGTKVFILKKQNQWIKVALTDNTTGWMKLQAVKTIKP